MRIKQLIEEIDPNETPDRVSRRFVTSDGRIFYARLEDEVVMICVVDAARPDWGKPNLVLARTFQDAQHAASALDNLNVPLDISTLLNKGWVERDRQSLREKG